MQCLLARTALAINGGGRDAFREPGGQHGVPPNVEALLADLGDTAPEHVINDCRIDASLRDDRAQWDGSKVNSVQIGQRALAGLSDTHRGTNSSTDNGIAWAHGQSPRCGLRTVVNTL